MNWLLMKVVSAVETSILPGDMCIKELLFLILKILVYGLGAAAVLGVIIAGIMYMTARDNETQVTKAKTRLFEIVIGLVAWAVMFAVLGWLVPGSVSLDLNQSHQQLCADETRSSTGEGEGASFLCKL